MFTKEERSTFSYWFAHWCAFQMTALNHRMWKPRYLLHDIEKPWMRLFMSYKKVQRWHRLHHKHHPEWLEAKLESSVNYYDTMDYISEFNYQEMIIDWECSRFTKEASPLTARQELEGFFNESHASKYPELTRYKEIFIENCIDVINKYEFE